MYSLASTSISTCITKHATTQHRRHFGKWLNIVFNKVDRERVKLVGPDRACSEWLLSNGAAIKWTDSQTFLKDYNNLPQQGRHYVHEVDATGSSISHYGFPHFQGCQHVEKIVLSECSYISDAALPMLAPLSKSLKHLEIGNCGDISGRGLDGLVTLSNLQTLTLYGLPLIEENDRDKVEEKLKRDLPNCDVKFL